MSIGPASGISFQGLGSGLNDNQIISAIMSPYQAPITLLQNQQSQVQTKEVAWQTVNTALLSFQNAADAMANESIWQSTAASAPSGSGITLTSTGSGVAGTYQAQVVQTAQPQQYISAAFTPSSESSALGVSGTITLTQNGNPTNITVSNSDSLDSIASNINSANLGISASVVTSKNSSNQTQYQLMLTSDQTGASSAFSISDTSGVFGASPTVIQAAQNAEIQLGTQAFYSDTNTFSGVIPGQQITVSQPTTTAQTITVTSDSSKASSAIQNFVTQYNNVMSVINQQLYAPDKKSSTDTTDPNPSGPLIGDPTLQMIQERLQSIVGSAFPSGNGTNGTIASLGIDINASLNSTTNGTSSSSTATSQSNSWQTSVGNLSFNSGEFNSQWNTSSAAMMQFVGAQIAGSASGSFVNAIDSVLVPLTEPNGTVSSLQTQLSNQYTSLGSQISDYQSQMQVMQNTLMAQYNQMEVVLSQIQSQSSALSSILGYQMGSSGTSSGSSSGPSASKMNG